MAIVAIHIRPPPYLAVTSGPSSHSPPPIWMPIITMPGPMNRVQCRQRQRLRLGQLRHVPGG